MSTSTFGKHQQHQLIIESVSALTDGELQEIASNIGLDAKNTDIINKKNPSLIAGLRISYQGKMLDLSLENQLNRIKESTDE